MNDPTRIAPVLDELRATWEAQPDLSLSTLFAMLETRGIGWGTDDAVLVQELQEMRRDNPSGISGYSIEGAQNAPAGPAAANVISARYVVETESPAYRITVDPVRVSVRRPEANSQPGVWTYERIRTCRVGSPLTVVDAGGTDHRLGVVSRITLLNDAPSPHSPPPLTGMTRTSVGDQVFYLVFEGGDTALLDHGLTHFSVSLREVEPVRYRWKKIIVGEVGEELALRKADGGVGTFGVVKRIEVLE
ncbi:hypothetical protein [Corynebacterium sputi]|uniref:hypothetical protein n=1 Tax=Corynebacterium sputi TaxID=489915 RepID=UPI00041C6E31|nr:hypothetical protein [Corynebacterium sputi]